MTGERHIHTWSEAPALGVAVALAAVAHRFRIGASPRPLGGPVGVDVSAAYLLVS